MSTSREHTRTELRLAEVQALAQSLDLLAKELATYREVLLLQLDGLRQEITASQNHTAPAKQPLRTRPTLQGEAMPLIEERGPGEARDSLLRGLEASGDPGPDAPKIPASSGIHRLAPTRHAAPRGSEPRPTPVEPAPPRRAEAAPPRRAEASPAPPRRAEASPAAAPPEPRRGDSGFRKTAPPLTTPEPTSKSDSGTRKGGKPISILIANDAMQGETPPIAGWVIERSANTLRLLVDDQLVVGTVYSIRPAKDHPNAQWVQVSIKSCHEERGSFAVIAQFVERPPWTALSLL